MRCGIYLRMVAISLVMVQWIAGYPQAAADNTLRRALPSLPSLLDPQQQSYYAQRLVLSDLFTGLTEIDQTGAVIPGAADRWSISEDRLTYVFHLRENGRWQDGTPVEAQDFVLAFARLFALGRKARQANIYADIKDHGNLATVSVPIDPATLETLAFGVRALDDRQLEITLKRPFEHLLFVLARPPAFPVPRHLYTQFGENWADTDKLVGNGPFRLTGLTEGSSVTLVKNPHFYDQAAVKLDGVHYLKPPEGATVGRFVAAGRADLSYQVPTYQIEAVRKLPGFQLLSQPEVSLTSVLINPHHPILADERIREALYLAVDRNALIRTLNSDYRPAFGLVPSLAGYEPRTPISLSRDEALERAHRLMTEAGFGDNKPLAFTLMAPEGIRHQMLAAQLRRDWKRININLTVDQRPFSEIADAIAGGTFDLVRRNWTADFPDPYNFLQLYTPAFNKTLFPALAPDVEALLEKAQAAPPQQRDGLLKQLEDQLMAGYPAVPLFTRTTHFLVSDRLKGWSPTAWAVNASRWLSLEP